MVLDKPSRCWGIETSAYMMTDVRPMEAREARESPAQVPGPRQLSLERLRWVLERDQGAHLWHKHDKVARPCQTRATQTKGRSTHVQSKLFSW